MTSLWLDDAYTPREALTGDVTAEVAIVGGGIAGVSAAHALAAGGARVLLLEAREIAAAASGRNAGFLLAGVAENFTAAVRRYGEEAAWRIYAFTRKNQLRVTELVAQHGIDCDLGWPGSLQIAGDDEEWREIRESVRLLSGRGVQGTLDESARAARYDADGELHPARFVRALAAAAERAGARVHERTRVVSVDRDGVTTERARVTAGAVILCTNAYTSALADSRVVPVRGQMLATAPLDRRVFERPAYAHRGYRYWRQTADGRILVGGWRDLAFDEEIGTDERTTETVQSALERFLRAHAPDAEITHRWAGTMGFSHDALPYIGRRDDGVFVCGGFTGHGMGFGVAAGELVATLATGGTSPDADLFRPDRP